MIVIIENVLTAALLAGLVFVAAVFVVRLVGQLRLHHRFANKRFMARYRAKHPHICRSTVDARSLSALPVIRRRTPADADRVPPNSPASAGPITQGRHVA